MEVHMRKLIVIAALALISSTSADAAVREFKFGGRTVRVEVPKNCKKISCMSISQKEKSARKGASSDDTASRAPAAAAVGTAAAAGVAAKAEEKPVEAEVQRDAVVRSEPKVEPRVEERKSVARLALPSSTVEEAKRGPQAAAVTPGKEDEPKAEPKAANSPLGVWITEKNAGRVRIEECGSNLCGYTVEKDNSNGKKVLIDMKPGGKRWNGRIQDVRSGKIYASHIAMRGSNALRVEGCAFGGLFCGGETWKRAE
jgi:uncharacterized protein (DUF2147 family)